MTPSPTPNSTPGASPSTLAGSTASSAPGNPEPDPSMGGSGQGEDKGMQMVIQKIRGMEADLLDIGKQSPGAGPEIRKAVDSIRSVLRKIVANPGAAEPSAPAITG